jgi:hypothetical protein
VQRRAYNWNARQPCCEPTPKHLISSADRHDSVRSASLEIRSQPKQHTKVKLGANQMRINRKFSREFFTEWSSLFQANDGRVDTIGVKTANQINQQSFRTTNGHASDYKFRT